MARSDARTPQSPAATCATCGEGMARDGWYYGTGMIPAPVHCDGATMAHTRTQYRNRPHHGHMQHAPCWRCGLPMGCDKCVGTVRAVVCTRCAVHATQEGLVEYGPLLNTEAMIRRRKGLRAPGLDEYPPDWQWAYREAQRHEAELATPPAARQAAQTAFDALLASDP